MRSPLEPERAYSNPEPCGRPACARACAGICGYSYFHYRWPFDIRWIVHTACWAMRVVLLGRDPLEEDPTRGGRGIGKTEESGGTEPVRVALPQPIRHKGSSLLRRFNASVPLSGVHVWPLGALSIGVALPQLFLSFYM